MTLQQIRSRAVPVADREVPERGHRTTRTDTYRFDRVLLFIILATTIDVVNFLDRGGPFRYLLLVPPYAAILLILLKRPGALIRRSAFSDRILFVLWAFGLCGTTYGVILRGTANTAWPIFLPMTLAFLYLATLEEPTEEEAAKLLRALAWIGSLYVCLNAFVNSGAIAGLTQYHQYRNSSIALAALGIGATVILKKWVRVAVLLLLAAYVFSTYPSATSLLVAVSTILTFFVTHRPGATSLRLSVVTFVAMVVIVVAFMNFGRTVSLLNDYFALVNKANANEGRIALWTSGLDRFKASPLIGTGFAGSTVSGAIHSKELPFHNDYVLFLAEGGAFGFGLLVGWMVFTEVTLVRRIAAFRRYGQHAKASLVRAVLVGLNAFFVAAAVNPVLPGVSRAATVFSLYAIAMSVGPPRPPTREERLPVAEPAPSTVH